tara:strand:- start:4 stop:1119 length:1116 start_codon:yes stop_codon:yes gene_type:complete
MKLVKSAPSPKAVAITATALSILCSGWILLATDNFKLKTDSYGKTMAESFAALTLEPLLTQNQMDLAIISNRIAGIDGIGHATVFNLDNEIIVTSGIPDVGYGYSHPVIFDDIVMGYVRVTLEPTIYSSPISTNHIGFAILMLISIPIFTLYILGYRAVRKAENPTQLNTQTDSHEEQRTYLIGINLHNQIALTPKERANELQMAKQLLKLLEPIYKSTTHDFPGTGLLMKFTSIPNIDIRPEILFAGFVVTGLLQTHKKGRYKVAIHSIDYLSDSSVNMENVEIRDLRSLTAITKENTVNVGNDFDETFLRGAEVDFQVLEHPLTQQMSAGVKGCYTIERLPQRQRALLAAQIKSILSNHEDSTDMDTTF